MSATRCTQWFSKKTETLALPVRTQDIPSMEGLEVDGAGGSASAAIKHSKAKHSRPYPWPLSQQCSRPFSRLFHRSMSRPVFSIPSRLVPPVNRILYSPHTFVLSRKWLPTFPACRHPAVNKREPVSIPSLRLRPARRLHSIPRAAPFAMRAPLDIL